MIRCKRGSNMAEAAITMPVVLLVLLFGINASLAGYTGMAAYNAANYGARVGAVTRNPDYAKFWAEAAAATSLKQSHATGIFGAPTARVDTDPGGAVVVSITWVYPSIFGGLCNFFGHICPDRFQGTAVSAWKKEGW
jgi:Flp pilus assembly protein TadG